MQSVAVGGEGVSAAAVQTEWRVQTFPSGTHIVTTLDADEAHLYVYGPKPVGLKDEEGEDVQADRNRFRMCEDLASFLNGGERPAWLDDMRRASETQLIGSDGSDITATGLMYDRNPPAMEWWLREDAEACDKRARLIDRLWLK
jgi:hypothetical protein